MKLKYFSIFALLICWFGVLPALGQDSDLKKIVDAIRQARTPIAPENYSAPPVNTGVALSPAACIVFLDGELVSDQILNKHTLAEVTEVALHFDPVYPIIYGKAGANGVIMITSRKEKPKK